MKLSEALQIRPGLTALVGGGGKTTLLYKLARELAPLSRVIVCTSTKILRPADLPVCEDGAGLASALAEYPIVCAGTPAAEGKLAAPPLSFEALTALADFVLVEADGAKGLPTKAHAPWEPVIPANTAQTVLVIGADCFGRPIGEICHRPERFAELAGVGLFDPVTPALLARILRAEGYGNIVYVNKTETDRDLANAEALAGLLPLPVVAGSLWRGTWKCLY